MTRALHPHRRAEHGFTMVVIAALFIAFAVIAAVAVERNTTVQLITRRDAAVEQLNRLSNAIIEYSVFNATGTTLLYPCPAAVDIDTTSASFGAAALNASSNCFNSALDPISGITVLGTDVIRGMVPVQTLSAYGISINDAFDPWNNRIMYVVNRKLTKAATPTLATDQLTNPTVSETRTTGQTIVAPDFILISYGRDGVGGIRRGATSVSIACAAASTVLRLENCDTDTAFNLNPTYTVASASAATYFDDILTFYRQ